MRDIDEALTSAIEYQFNDCNYLMLRHTAETRYRPFWFDAFYSMMLDQSWNEHDRLKKIEKSGKMRDMRNKSDKEVLDYLNKKSPSFCAAKWYNATIWLGSGMTTSCHHPPAHKIDDIAIITNPSAIHNTKEKVKDREQMLDGERPAGCDYCWKVEDNAPDAIPDRVHKSVIYSESDIDAIQSSSDKTNLKTLEISFDRTCNLACSYCNPAFSSTWVKDIKKNGPYTDLVTDGRNHFTHTHDSAQLFKKDEYNPYINAFWEWWELDLKYTLNELRITGGEPFMSDDVWKILDYFAEHKPNMQLAINSNLIMKPALLDKFIDRAKCIEHLHIYTSCEAYGEEAEYIRDGFNWEEWISNTNRIMEEVKPEGFHNMATVNALCLHSLPQFLDHLMEQKEKFGHEFFSFTLNIMRFPSFQSALILPDEILQEYVYDLQVWLQDNVDALTGMESSHVERLIEYLQHVDTPHDAAAEMPKLRNDFKKFFMQYDMRRDKNFNETFSHLTEWYDDL